MIYSLKNIEVQDAFVKLKEQIKCYLDVPAMYRLGKEILASTNFRYFTNEQRAVFCYLEVFFLLPLSHLFLFNSFFFIFILTLFPRANFSTALKPTKRPPEPSVPLSQKALTSLMLGWLGENFVIATSVINLRRTLLLLLLLHLLRLLLVRPLVLLLVLVGRGEVEVGGVEGKRGSREQVGCMIL